MTASQKLIALLTLIICYSCNKMQIRIEDNERGVMFKRFDGGVDTSKVFMPGKHSIFKHDQLVVYNLESKKHEGFITFYSKDKVKMELKIGYSFKPIPEKIALLHNYIGMAYHERVVKKNINSIVTDYFKNYSAADISSYQNKEYFEEILAIAKEAIAKRYVVLEVLQVKDLKRVEAD